MKMYEFTDAQRERLLDLLSAERDGVARGEIVGYGQSRAHELEDIDALIAELEK